MATSGLEGTRRVKSIRRSACASPSAGAANGRARSGERPRGHERRERQRLAHRPLWRILEQVERTIANVVELLERACERRLARVRRPDLGRVGEMRERLRELAEVTAMVVAALVQARLDGLEERGEVAQRLEDERVLAELPAEEVGVEMAIAHVGLDPEVVVARDVELPLQAVELVAAERGVQTAIEQHRRLVTEAHELVVELDALGERGRILAGVVAPNEVGQEIVLERDEIAAGTVERVAERRRFSGEAPTLVAEEALRAVGELRVAAHVEHLRAVEQRRDGVVTGEKIGEPEFRPAADVDGIAVADDADARHTVLQRDEPDPVTRIAEVDGREHAAAVADARAEALGPVRVEVANPGVASPHRRDRVLALGDAETFGARDEARAAGGVDEPAALAPSLGAVAAKGEAMSRAVGAELQVLHARAGSHQDAFGAVRRPEIALDAGAVDLEARMERQRHRPDLRHRVQLRVLRGRVEEETQAVLRQLPIIQIAGETEATDQVVARDLDRRFADLV